MVDLAQTAHDAIGNAPGTGAPTGTLWQFPDTETRDLTGRLFGDLQGARNANKFHIVKSTRDPRHEGHSACIDFIFR